LFTKLLSVAVHEPDFNDLTASQSLANGMEPDRCGKALLAAARYKKYASLGQLNAGTLFHANLRYAQCSGAQSEISVGNVFRTMGKAE
jgi:hypothetical protein